MSTTLAPPPVAAPPPTRGGAPARRAIRRWAWRLLRREWRQQVLILALLTVAVGTTTVGLGLVENVQGSDQALFGNANSRIDIASPGSDVSADLAAARQQFGTVEAIVHQSVPVPGSITPLDLRAQDPHGVFGAPMLHLASGRYPTGAGQAAVTSAAATTFGLRLGSTWSVNGQRRSIVGIVENPKDLQDAFGLVAPGQISSPSVLSLLFDASSSAVLDFHRPPSGTVQRIMTSGATTAQQQRNQALAVLLLATIGLTFIGLLSVAGFTVIAQRRVRAIGMIGAIGATDRQVRRVMLSNGAAVGAVGAALGTILGLAVWFSSKPAFEHLVGHRIDLFALPWWAVVAAAVLAILTAIAASWWPARSMARLPIVAALSGRPASPQPAHRFALLGTVLSAAGFVSLILAHAVHTVLIVAGILATTAGMLLLAPLGIRALAALAGRAPIAVRLALRDLARYQARSGAALAAASLAVGIAATIAVTAAGQQAHDHTLSGGNLPTNQLIVWLTDPNDRAGGPGLSVVPAGGPAGKPAVANPSVVASARSTADAIAQALGSSTVLELDTALDLNTTVPAGAPPDAGRADLVRPITDKRGRGWTQVTTPYVATPAILDFYRISGAGTTDILSARRDLAGVELGAGFKADPQPATVAVSALLPNYTSAPNTLITQQAMTKWGLTAEPAGWLIQARQPLTGAQITDARHRAAAARITIETRTAPDRSLQRLRNYATGAGVLVALGVLAMTVGLIRSETAGDLRTLTATGASGATRRTLNAATAGALALLGGILGTAAACLALIAWHWHHIGYLNRPPYLDLAVLILGLPVAAVVGAWVLGRTPRTLARRPLE